VRPSSGEATLSETTHDSRTAATSPTTMKNAMIASISPSTTPALAGSAAASRPRRHANDAEQRQRADAVSRKNDQQPRADGQARHAAHRAQVAGREEPGQLLPPAVLDGEEDEWRRDLHVAARRIQVSSRRADRITAVGRPNSTA